MSRLPPDFRDPISKRSLIACILIACILIALLLVLWLRS